MKENHIMLSVSVTLLCLGAALVWYFAGFAAAAGVLLMIWGDSVTLQDSVKKELSQQLKEGRL